MGQAQKGAPAFLSVRWFKIQGYAPWIVFHDLMKGLHRARQQWEALLCRVMVHSDSKLHVLGQVLRSIFIYFVQDSRVFVFLHVLCFNISYNAKIFQCFQN